MKRLLGNLISLAILGAVVYVYRAPLTAGWDRLYSNFFPCAKPITYSIGSFDTRFGISKETFLKAIADAEAPWEAAAGKQLFTYAPNGKMPVNLIYDYRQEATEKMRALGLTVSDDRASYDALTARYAVMKSAFQQKEAAYNAAVADIDRRTAAYNAEVSQWNKRKGAPADVYTRLEQESASLKADVDALHATQAELEKLRDNINALVTVINQVANNINVTADEFNKIGKTQGEEFTEGLYTSDRSGQRIDIYEFSDRQKLTRVLTHELGHALSLDHVDDPKAVMYRLNQGSTNKLAPSDIAELKAQCHIK